MPGELSCSGKNAQRFGRAKGDDVNTLGDQRIAIAGAGSAGIGIAQVLYEAMLEQGYSEEKAKDAFFIVDQKG